MIDPNAADYAVQVRMPASMAMMKLRGFVQDLGCKIIDGGPPGVVHVRLRAGGKSTEPWAIPGSWSGTGTGKGTSAKAGPSGLDLDMELRVQCPDPKQPDNLTIALTLRAAKNAWAISRREVQEHYDKILRDLKAYLGQIISSPGDFIPRP